MIDALREEIKMKRNTRFTIGHGLGVLFFALALSGCGGGGSSVDPAASPAQRVAQLESSGELPKLDRTDSISGIDANANGVRDDIEQYIEKKYAEPSQRAAAMQTARSLQQALLVDKGDVLAMEMVSEMGMRAVNCRGLVFPGLDGFKDAHEMSHQIEAMTTNTKKRLLTYLAYNKMVSGTVSQLPRGDTCD